VVALDIDGTLGDYHGHFWEFACSYLGRDLPANWPGLPRNWEDYLGITQFTYREIKLAYRQGGMKRNMPVYDGASALTRKMRDWGCEVWITTTRPYNRLDSVDPDTREWLRRHDIHYDHLLYDDDKYGRLAELVDSERVLLVYEDLPSQCKRASELFGFATVLMRYNTHNSFERTKFDGTDNLYTLVPEFLRRLKEWEAKYG
jgi:hypothetical protein